MINSPITSSIPASQAGATQAKDKPDAQSSEPFGALLLQQMDKTETPAVPAPAIAIHVKATPDSARNRQDKESVAADGDPASVLAAMLQLQREVKTPVVMDKTDGTAIRTTATDKTADHRPAAGGDITQATFEMKTDSNQVVRGISGQDKIHSTALASTSAQDPSIALRSDAAKGINLQPTAGSDITRSIFEMTGNPRGTSLPDKVYSAALTHVAVPPPAQDPVMASLSVTMPDMQAKQYSAQQTIATPLGSNGWAHEFSQKISWMSNQQNQVAELHLNPPDLGPLDVVLKISDNQATILFTSPHGAVRDAVENALPRLREILADNGITLGNTTVSDQQPRDRDAERFMGQGSGMAARRDDAGHALVTEGLFTPAIRIAPARHHNGMVDTFA